MGKTGKCFLAFVMSVVFTFAAALPARAAVTLEDLAKRVEALEAENASLKAEVGALKGAQAVQAADVAEVKTKTMTVVSSVPVASPAPSGNFLKTGMDISLYGFIKADAVLTSRDAGNTTTGITQYNALRPNSATGGDDPEAHLSAQDTRLGFKIKAPDLDNGAKLTGQIEFDFAGTSSSGTVGTYNPRLRLAFAQIDFDKWAVNAGQNWDIFAPMNDNLLNPGVLYRAGNLGTRHPQVSLINKWGNVLGGKLTTKIGAIDSDDPLIQDSGMPVAAAYAGYEKTVLGVKSTLGLGGMYGKLNLPTNGVSHDPIYAVTTGLTLAFTDWLSLKGEGFAGAGLNKFQGGPAQTTGNATLTSASKPLPVKGGFLELTLNPIKKTEVNFGYGIDDANEDMTAVDRGATTVVWDYNKTYYTNLKYNLSKDLLVGLEYQRFSTRWADGVQSSDNRVESSLILKF
ncbi:MAG: bZIP transcription factor [Candidatus Omnitrophota bacterium]